MDIYFKHLPKLGQLITSINWRLGGDNANKGDCLRLIIYLFSCVLSDNMFEIKNRYKSFSSSSLFIE